MGDRHSKGRASVRTPQQRRREQQSVVFVAMLLFSLVLVMLQIWLFVAVLENVLAGKTAMVLAATASSFVILGINGWMLRGIILMDRETR